MAWNDVTMDTGFLMTPSNFQQRAALANFKSNSSLDTITSSAGNMTPTFGSPILATQNYTLGSNNFTANRALSTQTGGPSGTGVEFNNNSSFFPTSLGGWAKAGLDIANTIGGLASAYVGYKNYKLAKEAFGFQKGLANRNIANQAKIINNTYDNAGTVSAGLSGSWGYTSPEMVAQMNQQAKDRYVDGSPIG